MTSFKIKLLLLLYIVPIISYSQKIGNGVENIYKSVGFIVFADSPFIHSGTGTLVYKIMGKSVRGNNLFSIFLITAKHVLPTKTQSDSIIFWLSNPNNSNTFISFSIPIFDTRGIYVKEVKTDPSGNDIAVINITDLLTKDEFNAIIPFIPPSSLLIEKDSIKHSEPPINIGDEVYFIGYPSFFFDQRNISPIIRTGVISTPPERDFYFNNILRNAYSNQLKSYLPPKLNGFLIDGNIINGSSGSVVFLKPKEIYYENGAEYAEEGGGRPIMLGILTDSYLDIDSAHLSQRVNLGAVISSGLIRNIIDSFKLGN